MIRVPGQASEAAVKAAYSSLTRAGEVGPTGSAVRRALEAASDPALGLDRSVCLCDVVEWLRSNSEENHDPSLGYIEGAGQVAFEIEAHFTARSSSSPEGGSSE